MASEGWRKGQMSLCDDEGRSQICLAGGHPQATCFDWLSQPSRALIFSSKAVAVFQPLISGVLRARVERKRFCSPPALLMVLSYKT